jgi:hypothetical protein
MISTIKTEFFVILSRHDLKQIHAQNELIRVLKFNAQELKDDSIIYEDAMKRLEHALAMANLKIAELGNSERSRGAEYDYIFAIGRWNDVCYTRYGVANNVL